MVTGEGRNVTQATKAQAGQRLTSVTHRQMGQAVSEQHARADIPHVNKSPDGEVGEVTVTIRHTKNLGNYESLSVEVGATRQCHADNLDGAILLTQKIIEPHIFRIFEEWVPGETD